MSFYKYFSNENLCFLSLRFFVLYFSLLIHIYSQTEKFNVENNLLFSFIPDALFTCPKLEVVNLSRNQFEGRIPASIGLLKDMREILFRQNSLSGPLPPQIFTLEHIEHLDLQSNSFVGTIPPQIGNIKTVSHISLSHNFFKGSIPKELDRLSKIEYLHLHDNFLTGTAPFIPRLRELGSSTGEVERYITDCGDRSHVLPNPVICPSCTLCCNSDNLCQENKIWPISMDQAAFIVMFALPIGLAIISCLVHIVMAFFNRRIHTLDQRSTVTLVDDDSTYCLIFSNSFVAKFIYVLVFFLQGTFYYMFLQASSFTSESSDWQFTFQCSSSSFWCENRSTVSLFGWTMFFVVTIFTLSVDYINSALLILKAVDIMNLKMLVSGFLHFGMTVMALFCSFYYNKALATTNTELIINAVILLFINDLDEQLMNAMQALVPDWVDTRIEEVRTYLTSTCAPSTERKEQADLQSLEIKSSTAQSSQAQDEEIFFDNYRMNVQPAIETILTKRA